MQPEENRGLRLKEPFRQDLLVNDEDTGHAYALFNGSLVYALNMSSQEPAAIAVADNDAHRVVENFFDAAGYVAGATLKPGEDAYAKNKFNQAASDRLASNRDIPDTRMSQYVFTCAT